MQTLSQPAPQTLSQPAPTMSSAGPYGLPEKPAQLPAAKQSGSFIGKIFGPGRPKGACTSSLEGDDGAADESSAPANPAEERAAQRAAEISEGAARRLRSALEVIESGTLEECPLCLEVPSAADARVLRCCAAILCRACIHQLPTPAIEGAASTCPMCRGPFQAAEFEEAAKPQDAYAYTTLDYAQHGTYRASVDYGDHGVTTAAVFKAADFKASEYTAAECKAADFRATNEYKATDFTAKQYTAKEFGPAAGAGGAGAERQPATQQYKATEYKAAAYTATEYKATEYKAADYSAS